MYAAILENIAEAYKLGMTYVDPYRLFVANRYESRYELGEFHE